jgi:hypothetical protein
MRWICLAVLSVELLMPHNGANSEPKLSNSRLAQMPACCESYCPKPLPLECLRRLRSAPKPKPAQEPCKRRSDGECER